MDLVGITFSQALSSLSAHDVSIGVSMVEIPVGLKGRTYQVLKPKACSTLHSQVIVMENELLGKEDVLIGFSAPVAYVLCYGANVEGQDAYPK